MKQNIFTHLHKTLSCERFYKTLFHYIGESFFFSFQKLCIFLVTLQYLADIRFSILKVFVKLAFFSANQVTCYWNHFNILHPQLWCYITSFSFVHLVQTCRRKKRKCTFFLGYIGIYRLLAALTHLQFLSSKLIIDNACRSHIWLLMLLEQAWPSSILTSDQELFDL